MSFQTDGFAIIPGLVSPADCDALIRAVSSGTQTTPGTRTLLAIDAVARVAATLRTHPAVSGLMSDRHRVIQCSLFAKGVASNWSVASHQDLSMPVPERFDAPGWTGWSMKEGGWFVQPPATVLEQLVAIRLQLDGHAEETGPLEVAPGSHVLGRLSSAEAGDRAKNRIRCIVPRGGALVMRPLLIHASGKSKSGLDRRVLHFVYGPPVIPGSGYGTR
ncbi:MAG: phytanoyl-CoA dioxygenase family protein [Mycobacterium sp.]